MKNKLFLECSFEDKTFFQTERIHRQIKNSELFSDLIKAYKVMKKVEARREAAKEAS